MEVDRRTRGGFTLIELVISSVSASLLMAGMGSAMFLAMKAAETDTSVMNTLEAGWVLDEMITELQTALYFKERTATSVKFVVADQTEDGNTETIHYSWSGTAGDPLTRTFNSQSAVDVAEDVQAFALAYTVEATTADARILLVASNGASPSSQDLARKAQMEDWGYEVLVVDDGASQSTYGALISQVQAAYVSEQCSSGSVNTKLLEASIGVLSDEPYLNDAFKVSSSNGSGTTSTQIDIVNNTHYITSTLSTGLLTITSVSQENTRITGTLAAGLTTLAEQPSGSTPTLAVLDFGDTLYGSGTAAGRRVMLPWGRNDSGNFNFDNLTPDALTIMQRSLEWAIGGFELTRVSVGLQIGSTTAGLGDTDVEILNRTRVTAP